VVLSEHAVRIRARALKMLLFDVDGVLTDASVVISGNGSESKTFSIRDGSALVWAKREGLEVGLLSGRTSDATAWRAAELGIRILVQGAADKRAAYRQILETNKLADEQVAYMGDDLIDLPVLGRAGLSAAPADAATEVLAHVNWVSRHAGGRGAVREFVEVVLRAKDRWDSVVQAHTD
jgi:3-deoxy-D-manno-octulosonate 8-phosphate phosphatase (KDO 8-P phosphatase)